MSIRFGIIGCGYIAERHLKHITDHADAQAIGVFDVLSEAAHKLAGDYRLRVHPDIDSLLNDSQIDIVSVCTPNGSHAELSIAALKAGKHVLVEKPMAICPNDARAMVETAQACGKQLYVVKQNRYNPPVQAVKQLIEQGKLGQIYAVNLNCYWNRNEEYYKQSNWKGTKALDGGTLYTQFSHFIDILYYLFGEIENVDGRVGNFGHQKWTEFEDTGSFTFCLKQGGIGNLNFTTCAFRENMEGSISIFTENATLKIGGKYLNTIDFQNTKDFDIKHLPASGPANNYGFYQGSMSNHDKVIHNVIEALHGREQIMTGAKEGLKVVEMIHQFYKAAKWINLP
jgi:predicted dehydrogenase